MVKVHLGCDFRDQIYQPACQKEVRLRFRSDALPRKLVLLAEVSYACAVTSLLRESPAKQA